MTETHPFTAEEQAAIAELTKAPQIDVNGVAFNPAIHAVKKDGNPKKTPQGAWAVLDKNIPYRSAEDVADGVISDGFDVFGKPIGVQEMVGLEFKDGALVQNKPEVAETPVKPKESQAEVKPEIDSLAEYAGMDLPSDDLYDPSNPPPDTDEAAYLEAKKALEKDIETLEVAKTREALKGAGSDTVLAFMLGDYRAWLPRAEAEKRIKEGTCLRYEAAS